MNTLLFIGERTREWDLGLHEIACAEALQQLLDHISTKSLLEHLSCPYYRRKAGFSPLFSGLHCASFGIVELAAALIEMEGCDVNQGDLKGGMPPILAATSEHEGVLKQSWNVKVPYLTSQPKSTEYCSCRLLGGRQSNYSWGRKCQPKWAQQIHPGTTLAASLEIGQPGPGLPGGVACPPTPSELRVRPETAT